jgi:hypothetical protein
MFSLGGWKLEVESLLWSITCESSTIRTLRMDKKEINAFP